MYNNIQEEQETINALWLSSLKWNVVDYVVDNKIITSTMQKGKEGYILKRSIRFVNKHTYNIDSKNNKFCIKS